MKAFVVLAAVLASASASPQIYVSGLHGLTYGGIGPITYAAAPTQAIISAPITYTTPALVAPVATKTQYHAQDELGQASYGYAHPGQAHSAVRDAFGNVVGSYAYVNPDGKEVRVNYVADGAGFRVASNDLPVGPAVPAAPELKAPEPVQDTPEVAEAKAAHAKAVEEAIARNAEADKADAAAESAADKPQSRRKRGIIAAAPIALATPSSYAVHVATAPAITYSAIATPVVRQATLTKVINTPGHAVSYRVD